MLAGALLAALLAYYLGFELLPNLPTTWDLAFVALLLIPAVFALVWLALPLRRRRGLLPTGLAFAALAFATSEAGLPVVANFAKLAAATAIAFWFLGYFETALWVALVALLIPVVDAYSVWRGPTQHILSERPEVFSALSFSFPLPGERQVLVRWRPPESMPDAEYRLYREPGPAGPVNEEPLADRDGDGELGWLAAELDARADYVYRIEPIMGGPAVEVPVRWRDADGSVVRVPDSPDPRAPRDVTSSSDDSSAKLGVPDLLFFALFLAAADRFGLRRRLTWLALTASFGLTLAGAYLLGKGGLPALPLLALGFLAANADLLRRAFRERK